MMACQLMLRAQRRSAIIDAPRLRMRHATRHYAITLYYADMRARHYDVDAAAAFRYYCAAPALPIRIIRLLMPPQLLPLIIAIDYAIIIFTYDDDAATMPTMIYCRCIRAAFDSRR